MTLVGVKYPGRAKALVCFRFVIPGPFPGLLTNPVRAAPDKIGC